MHASASYIHQSSLNRGGTADDFSTSVVQIPLRNLIDPVLEREFSIGTPLYSTVGLSYALPHEPDIPISLFPFLLCNIQPGDIPPLLMVMMRPCKTYC